MSPTCRASGPRAIEAEGRERNHHERGVRGVQSLDVDSPIDDQQVGGIGKASLHADESWRVAMTREHQDSGKAPILTDGHRYAQWEFTPTDFEDGGRLAFVIATFRNALVREQLDPRDTVVEVGDRWDRLTAIYVWMTEPGVTLKAHNIIGGPLALSSGRRVWVTSGEENIKIAT